MSSGSTPACSVTKRGWLPMPQTGLQAKKELLFSGYFCFCWIIQKGVKPIFYMSTNQKKETFFRVFFSPKLTQNGRIRVSELFIRLTFPSPRSNIFVWEELSSTAFERGCCHSAPKATSTEVVFSGSSCPTGCCWTPATLHKPPLSQDQMWGDFRGYRNLSFWGCHFRSWAIVCCLLA